MRAAAGFVPLHVKSHHSIGLGTASIPALVQHAGRLGFSSLALTDLESLHGQVGFHVACAELGLAPITGVELRTGFRPRHCLGAKSGRLILLAESAVGYASLCQIVTRRRTGPTPSRPPVEFLEGSTAGLFLLSDDASLLGGLVALAGRERVRALLVRPGSEGHAREQTLTSTARELGVSIVADIDAELLDARDRDLQRLARAVHLSSRLGELSRSERTSARPLLAPAEAAHLFSDVPWALEESARIAEACRFDLLRWHAEAPLARSEPLALHAELEQRCRSSLRAASAGPTPPGSAHAERLALELEVIRALGLTELFTTCATLADDARARRIPFAARGSAVSSLVLHLLGLSPIDPVRHGLLFERFVSASRRSPPDIDIDVASRRRDELTRHLIDARGVERTARLASLATFRPRSAHREGLKALGVPAHVIDTFLRAFPPDELQGHDGWRLPTARLPAPWCEHLGLIRALVGMPRHLALHPGGIALSRARLDAGLPLEARGSGVSMCQYDAESIAHLGIPKIDLLGSHCLDEIEATLAGSLDSIPGERGAAELSADPPLDDPETLALIDQADTLGCFQLESPPMRAVLASLPVRNLEDLTHALAIVRPGPASGQAKSSFITRARGEAGVPALHVPEQLSARRLATQGLLLYEEDVALTLAEMTGVTLAEAEALRVRLGEREGDSEWIERARQRFMRAALARGFTPARSAEAWAVITRFARYSFNKAHATSQALLAYRSAYCKAHAPVDFGCALLNHHGGAYPRRVIAADLWRRHVPISPPSLLHSELECTVEALLPAGERGIRIGLGLVKGVRAVSHARILAGRTAATSAAELEALLLEAELRPRELRALVWSGACDDVFALGSADYPWVHEAVLQRLEGARTEPLSDVIARARARAPGEPALLVDRYRRLRRLQNELSYLGMHVSDHPMRVLRSEAEQAGCVPSHRLREHAAEDVTFAGVIAAARSVPIAERDAAQFLTFEDEHGLVEARLGPDVYDRLHPRVTTPGPFLVHARVVARHGALHLLVRELIPFHQRAGVAASVERSFDRP